MFLWFCLLTLADSASHGRITAKVSVSRDPDTQWVSAVNHLREEMDRVFRPPNEYNQTMAMTVSFDNITNLLSNVSTIISEHYRHPLQRMHVLGLCMDSYNVIMDIQEFNQRQLVRMMKMIISQNINLNIGLETFIWEQFFKLFYKSPNQYRDGYICQLLGIMQSEGSHVSPTLNIFNEILHGISINPGLRDPYHLVDLLMNDIMPSHGIQPDQVSYHSLFRVLRRTGNRGGALCLLLNQANVMWRKMRICWSSHAVSEVDSDADLEDVIALHHDSLSDTNRRRTRNVIELRELEGIVIVYDPKHGQYHLARGVSCHHKLFELRNIEKHFNVTERWKDFKGFYGKDLKDMANKLKAPRCNRHLFRGLMARLSHMVLSLLGQDGPPFFTTRQSPQR